MPGSSRGGESGRRNFKRVIEDFVCDNCGEEVIGSGYTDHCTKCLWGKHVDNVPGDRASKCRGMMKPQWVLYENGNYVIFYKCTKCGVEKRFKAASNDSKDALEGLIKNAGEEI